MGSPLIAVNYTHTIWITRPWVRNERPFRGQTTFVQHIVKLVQCLDWGKKAQALNVWRNFTKWLNDLLQQHVWWFTVRVTADKGKRVTKRCFRDITYSIRAQCSLSILCVNVTLHTHHVWLCSMFYLHVYSLSVEVYSGLPIHRSLFSHNLFLWSCDVGG